MQIQFSKEHLFTFFRFCCCSYAWHSYIYILDWVFPLWRRAICENISILTYFYIQLQCKTEQPKQKHHIYDTKPDTFANVQYSRVYNGDACAKIALFFNEWILSAWVHFECGVATAAAAACMMWYLSMHAPAGDAETEDEEMKIWYDNNRKIDVWHLEFSSIQNIFIYTCIVWWLYDLHISMTSQHILLYSSLYAHQCGTCVAFCYTPNFDASPACAPV